jgi:hypothetical protein
MANCVVPEGVGRPDAARAVVPARKPFKTGCDRTRKEAITKYHPGLLEEAVMRQQFGEDYSRFAGWVPVRVPLVRVA